MAYFQFIKMALVTTIAITVPVGLLLGLLMALAGSVTFNLSFDLAQIDGLYLLLGIPTLSVLLTLLVSPMSLWLFRLLTGSRSFPT